jgi:DNA-directed RNA polymerase subunit alpha
MLTHAKENSGLQQEEITSTNPKVDMVHLSSELGIFQIEPLTSGFGLTLGNALRRVLLSSLPGAAITEIQLIDSEDDKGRPVVHEFSSVRGVREDTTELILNLKQVRLKSHTDHPVRGILDAKGPGVVTAADIQVGPDIDIVNPDLPIATLDNRDSHLDIRLTIESGLGYLTAEGRESPSIGVIPIDAVFTPIRRVNYRVEKTRVGARTDYDRLLLEIQTDGTLGPKEALSEAAQVLIRQFETFAQLTPQPIRKDGVLPPFPSTPPDMSIEMLELTARTYNCLKRSQITTVAQLLQMSPDDLLQLRNFGQKSLQELREQLVAHDVPLPASWGEPLHGPEGVEDEEEADEEEGEEEWAVTQPTPVTIFEDEMVEEPEYEEEEEEYVRPRSHRPRPRGRSRGDDDE